MKRTRFTAVISAAILSMTMSTCVMASAEETEIASDESELNEYGLTDAWQEALLDSVETSVTEGYLEKYGIAAADFNLLPYDVQDLNNYGASGEYTGQDPWESAALWDIIQSAFVTPNLGLVSADVMGVDMAADMLADLLVMEDTLELQSEYTGYAFDTSSEKYALADSVYEGIVNFLKGLDVHEAAEVLVNLYIAGMEGNEWVPVGPARTTYNSKTMFDRVLSENLQFS